MREKAEKDKKKAEEKKKKEEEKAAAGGGAAKPKAAAAFEEEVDPSKYTENRKNFVQQVRDSGVNPYPHKFTRTHRIDEFRTTYEASITENVFIEDQTVSLTGRILSIRASGAKLIFIDLEGDNAKVQIMATINNY